MTDVAAILDRLSRDGFLEIGEFEIDGPVFRLNITRHDAEDWRYAVYAWVSVLHGGSVLRLGKCEGPLRARIEGYKRSLDSAMSGRLAFNERFRGDTAPWELAGWRLHAGAPKAGRLFARTVQVTSGQSARDAVIALGQRLIEAYDPPLCGVSAAGRRLRKQWVGQHGPIIAVRSRDRPK